MLHHYVVPLAAFAVAALVFTITPGLDTVMILRTAAADGRRCAAGAILGIGAGLSLWGIGAVFGLTALLAASATAFMAVKFAGALYLAWMGIGLLFRPRSGLTAPEGQTSDHKQSTHPFWMGFQRGLLTDILNPKVGIFVITFFPQFIPHHVDMALFTLLQAFIQVVLSVLWLGLLVLLTVPLAGFFNRPTVMRRLDRLTGLIFIGFGAKLFMTHNPH
ncbi:MULTISPECIES: LysE family translocator [unclassified Saccharibacter]|uniref:LysE family translocator n=1 Tax=unclassified Saccharibacter TaxID=2648722 RepID=UPI0013206E25|nr:MULTISPECIES: LysE family translocator [unclassified Saccharibacter]MXV36076.1 LysE family transporter [Saccharibacter sp. EH611]MXV56935.1 LysE family transporter [Saccharibacter sp. EH70]MXV66705.1 LysE family transporter [Saccharibacter sp. EH60]